MPRCARFGLMQSPSPHGWTRMIVFPLIRSVGLKAATASSRAATLPMFVRSRPFRASRPFPQPYPSPQSPSSVTSLCRVLACKAPLHPLSLDGLSDRNGSIKILASPASMRNAEWPCHVCFIGIASSVSSVLLNGGGDRFVVGVDDDDSEQLRRLGLARVAADWMVRVRRFGPALAGLINAGLAVVHLWLDLTRDHIGVDEGRLRVRVRRGSRAWCIVDFQNDERLTGDVRNRLIEFRRDRFGLTARRRGGPGNREGEGGADSSDDGADLHGLSPSTSPKIPHTGLEKSTNNAKKSCLLDEVAVPKPAPGEVLIRVHATAVTTGELEWYPTWHTPKGAPRVRAVPGHDE